MPFDAGSISRPRHLRRRQPAGAAPLVFLHGLTFDHHMWDPVIDALPPGQQAIALDLPGHGVTPGLESPGLEDVAGWVHEAVLVEGLERPVVVGHSIGAGIATIYAARYPASGVVNVDGGVRVEPLVHGMRALAPRLRDDFDGVWSTIFRPSMQIGLVREEHRELLRAGAVADRELVLRYWADLLGPMAAELPARVDAMMRTVGALGIPYVSISRTPLTADDAAWLLERIPHAELVDWQVRHHFPQLERPAEFAARVAAVAAGSRI